MTRTPALGWKPRSHEQMKSRQFPLRVLANGLKEEGVAKLGGDPSPLR